MKTVCKEGKCNACGACVDVCPLGCVSIIQNYFTCNAFIREEKCIKCKKCERICPAINAPAKKQPISWYQGWASDTLRSQSASGGIAFAIMRNFIDNGGCVATCLFKDGNFLFDIVEKKEGLGKFIGSKYVKSNPEGIYKRLSEKIKYTSILFVGLPCQVAAVRNILKNNDNLYTIDLICHGTPNMSLLNKYLTEEKYDINEIEDISFRRKGDSIDYVKIKEYVDEYMLSFLYSVCFTDNCYKCEYAQKSRVSDITLGDSWGTNLVEEINKGVSLILVQSEKGQKILQNADVILKEVDIKNAINNNQQLETPVAFSDCCRKFQKSILKGDSYSKATRRAIPRAVFIQKIKKIKNRVMSIDNKNQFGLSVLYKKNK